MKSKKQASKKEAVTQLSEKDQEMVRLALKAQTKAYAPYSKYKVGSCIRDSRGKLYTGCNVENASYSATICAERSAICQMVSDGGLKIQTVVVVTSSEEPAFPCGVCRQVLYEFGSESEVICLSSDGKSFKKVTMPELLPFAFGKADLEK